MIYRLLKFLFYFAVKGYFKSIRIRNIDRVPSTGPVIFVANHTSAFMDPIILALFIKRELFFLARGEAFKSKIVSSILTRLNLIPIFRPEVTPDEVYKNKQVFSICYKHLFNGNCLLIFPEGFSKTERRLRKLKTGTARIAFGAEADHDFKLGLQILPIGLNYSNPHIFRSEAFINVGRPIEVVDYKKEYEENAFASARRLTTRIKGELEQRTIVIQQTQLDELIGKIERIYDDELKDSLDQGNSEGSDKFLLSKEIVKVVDYFFKNDKNRVIEFSKKINRYFENISKLGLKDSHVKNAEKKEKIISKAWWMIFALPLAVYGIINNFIAFKATKYLVLKMTRREDFRGSLQLSLGLLCFLLMYLLQAWVVSCFFSPILGLIYFLSLYPSGIFALYYLKNFYKTRNKLRTLISFSKESNLASQLMEQRQNILKELEKGRLEYEQKSPA